MGAQGFGPLGRVVWIVSRFFEDFRSRVSVSLGVSLPKSMTFGLAFNDSRVALVYWFAMY